MIASNLIDGTPLLLVLGVLLTALESIAEALYTELLFQ
jgi:hypothetical protein